VEDNQEIYEFYPLYTYVSDYEEPPSYDLQALVV
jgi:hypothetical protein